MEEGMHLILDLKGCGKAERLSDKKFIESFLLELVKIIEMKAITRPNVLYYEHERREESGITGFIIIADSHISIHTYPFKKSLYFDLFSCKKFDWERVIGYVKEKFEPEQVRLLLLTR